MKENAIKERLKAISGEKQINFNEVWKRIKCTLIPIPI